MDSFSNAKQTKIIHSQN